MAFQLIQRPGTDLFALFSSESCTFVVTDATAEEILDWFVTAAAKRARAHTQRVIDHVRQGRPEAIYHQHTMTWDDAAELDRRHADTTL